VPSAAVASGEVAAVPYVLIDGQGKLLDTIAVRPVRNSQIAFRRDNGATYIGQPFNDEPLVAISHDGTQIAVVERSSARRSDGAQFRVTRSRVGGANMYTRAYSYRPVPIPRAYTDSLIRARAEGLSQGTRAFFSNVREAESNLRKEMYVPDYYAPVSAAIFAEDGSLWLRREARAGDPQLWEVHSTSGNVLGTVTFPEKARVLVIQGNVVWTSETDDLDVPYVVRYRVQRGSSR
jgi:hypothetical protein